MASTRGGAAAASGTKGTSSSGSSLVKKSPRPSSSNPGEKTSSPKPASTNLRTPTKTTTKRSKDSSAQKQTTLSRRKSPEKPPATPLVQKALEGAGTTGAKPDKSPSSSAKGSTSSKEAPERQPSIGKGSVRDKKAEPQLFKTRSLNKGTVGSKPSSKSSGRLARNKKGPKSVTSESSNECDPQSIEHLVSDEDMAFINQEHGCLPEISEMPGSNEELMDPTSLDQFEAKQVEEEQADEEKGSDQELDMNLEESPDQEEKPTAEEEEPAPGPEEIRTPEKLDEDQATPFENRPDQKTSDEEPMVVHQENVHSGEQNSQTGEGALAQEEPPKEEPTKKESPAPVKVEENKESPKKEMEEDQKETVITTSPPKVAVGRSTISAPTTPDPASKKENQDYNDVIEQTATKLMGSTGRKNKVLALAGAFERVISLQDGKN